MSEELTAQAAAPAAEPQPSAPVEVVTEPVNNAVPVAPETPAAPEAPTASQAAVDAVSEGPDAPPVDPGNPPPEQPIETTQEEPEPAAAEPAPAKDPDGPISAETGLPAEPLKAKIQEPTPAPAPVEPAAEEAPDPIDVQIQAAKEWIISSRKSSAAALQNAMRIPLGTCEKILAKLEEYKILGPAKEDGSPRDILVASKTPKITVSQKPQGKFNKQKKPVMSDEERVQNWTKHLKEIGKLDDDRLIKQITDYALRNQGFNPHAKWGSCLIVMINRTLNRLRDSLRTFTQSDADYLCRELLRFASEQPLGDGVGVWNSRYSSNMEQKEAVSEFFGINRSFRDLRGSQKIVMTAIRDAAWPTKQEEKNGTGGTYAERFHYLALAIVTFGSGDYATELFRNCVHHEPTEAFLERINGGRPVEKAPAWQEDGHCKDCGNEIVKDSAGNDVCSNPICPNHFAKVSVAVPKSFRSGGFRQRNDIPTGGESVPQAAPEAGQQRRNKKNWKKNRRDDDGGDMPKNNFRKHGKRWRPNEDEFDGGSGNGGGNVDPSNPVISVGQKLDTTMASAFAGINVPTAEPAPAPAEPAPAVQPAEPVPVANDPLPDPPPEVPAE